MTETTRKTARDDGTDEGELPHVAETGGKPAVNIDRDIAVTPGGAARSAPILDPAEDTVRPPGR
jgi:hypothetical protein